MARATAGGSGVRTCLSPLARTVRIGERVFRGATVIATLTGESQEEAEARADRLAWRILVPLMAITGLVCYAFIVWQAALHH